MMTRLLPSLATALLSLAAAGPAWAAQAEDGRRATRLTDEELARVTGKFILPNGVELALTVTSDTVVNGQLLLRTVLAVDSSAQLQVLGRREGDPPTTYVATSSAQMVGGGVTVALDRKSGIQTITPTVALTSGPAVSVGKLGQTAESLGLSAIPLTPGGPAIATADGTVSLETVRNGSRVTFESAQLSIVNLVGQSVATAVLNSADNRTLDTVTTIAIDARNIAPYQASAAQIRVSDLAVEATRGMIR